MSDLKIKVSAGSVSLFLTLSPGLQQKCLDKCVINPFIKAYNKKTGDPESLETITECTLSGSAADGPVSRETASDEAVQAGSLLGTGENVCLTLSFPPRAAKDPEDPPLESMPMFTEGMSEVEKLKARRRAENAAKRAANGGVDVSDNAAEAAPAAPPPQAEAAPAPKGPLGQIEVAEGKLESLMSELTAVTALVAEAADADSLDAAAKRQAAVSAGVGQLTAMMDEIDIGEIEDDEARSAARARRKAINKRCALASSGDVEVDGDLAGGAAALKKAVVAKRAALK